MQSRIRSNQAKKLVWRISDAAPMGEWVDPSAGVTVPAPRAELPEVSSGGWIVSSFDLLNGADVDDGPNTVPDELFDELFAPKQDARKPSK